MNNLKLIFISILVFLSTYSFSNIDYVKVDGDQYYAHFKCSNEEKVLADINSFIELRKDIEHCDNGTIENVDANNCRINLNSCLPESLSNKLGTSYPISGPNCYGTSLYTTKNYKHVRFVSVDEFDAIVESPYCESVEDSGPGVIGHFTNDFGSIHAFTYITKNLSFERLGFDYNGVIYPFIANYTPNTIYKWEADSFCRRYAGKEKKCFNKLRYTRCDISGFYASLPTDIKNDLEKLEDLVNLIILNQSNKPLDAIKKSRKIILELNRINLSVKKSDRKIFIEMLNSIKDQLDSAKKIYDDVLI
jgi:hypothetical protein